MQISESTLELLTMLSQTDEDLFHLLRSAPQDFDTIAAYLIAQYRNTDDLEARSQIFELMKTAGYSWLRKLFMRSELLESAAA